MLQAWLARVREQKPKIVIFENVKGYEVHLLFKAVSDLYEIKRSNVDPRFFQVPMSRPRVWVIMFLKEEYKWVGDGSAHTGWLDMMECLQKTQPAEYDPTIFAADPDTASCRSLTSSEKKHLTQYMAITQAPMVDPSQSAGRPVHSLVDGAMPCLRTSSIMYMPILRQFVSGKQLLKAMGFPTQLTNATKMRAQPMNWNALELEDKDLREIAGNGMFMPVAALAVLCALMFVAPKHPGGA